MKTFLPALFVLGALTACHGSTQPTDHSSQTSAPPVVAAVAPAQAQNAPLANAPVDAPVQAKTDSAAMATPVAVAKAVPKKSAWRTQLQASHGAKTFAHLVEPTRVGAATPPPVNDTSTALTMRKPDSKKMSNEDPYAGAPEAPRMVANDDPYASR